MPGNHYDLIVIGSGPGGASLAQRLAPTGKKILLLERGDYLPRSVDNWDSQKVFVEGVYQAKETWYGKDGEAFQPGLHYFVGGNSKMYGAALFRLRGQRGEDPNEPWSSGPFPYPPVSHEPRVQALHDSLQGDGLHPFHLPMGILLDEKDGKT